MPIYGTTMPDPGPYRVNLECERCGRAAESRHEIRQLKRGPWAGKPMCRDCRDVEFVPAALAAPVMSAPTHCRHGHARTPDNLIKNGNTLVCKTCRSITQAKYLARKRGEA